MARIFPKLTATGLQATTYLLGIALFSIAFLVFLNSSISFVITDILGQEKGAGDAVGTLGFADELLALVACPLWGILSDRIGVRTVAVTGYMIVGFALVCLVQSTELYPDLLVWRLVFSVGGAACSTMVTAVLPAMVMERVNKDEEPALQERAVANGHAARLRAAEDQEARRGSIGHGATPSVSSELTITQTRYTSRSDPRQHGLEDVEEQKKETKPEDKSAGTSQLAGFVGLFTGAGALIALVIFLPLPAYFQKKGQSPAQSLQMSFYIVAAIAFCVAIFIFFGLRNLPGEEDKSMSHLCDRPYDETTDIDPDGNLHTTLMPTASYLQLIKESLLLGTTDADIFLGYLGGFVARASSVAISLFIPFFVKAYFTRTGKCHSNPDDLPDIRKNCQQAYILASALSGIAETAALICAPLFGWLGGRVAAGGREWPLFSAAAIGVGGYVAFGLLESPDAFHGDGGQWALLAVIMIGISQIGSIVCSLGLLGRGINKGASSGDETTPQIASTAQREDTGLAEGAEAAPLLPSARRPSQPEKRDRARLRGSIAGMYSFVGGAGILLLTKLGGSLADSWTAGAPFFIMAIFNAVLLVAVIAVGIGQSLRRRETSSVSGIIS